MKLNSERMSTLEGRETPLSVHFVKGKGNVRVKVMPGELLLCESFAYAPSRAPRYDKSRSGLNVTETFSRQGDLRRKERQDNFPGADKA